MRNRTLHDALLGLARAASRSLLSSIDDGQDMPFEVVEEPGARTTLYRYRPLTAEFIDSQLARLGSLKEYMRAVEALETVDGLAAYLRALGEHRALPSAHHRAQAAAACFLKRIWEEASSFELDAGRFERAHAELEGLVFEGRLVINVVAALVGLRPIARRLELTHGLAIAPGDSVDAPPQAIWPAGGGDGGDPHMLATLAIEQGPDQPLPAAVTRIRFRRLLSALRLFKEGAAALGPIAYARSDAGPWQPLHLGYAGRARGAGYWLEPAELEEFRDFHECMGRRRTGSGPLAWALARFEMGCERPTAVEGLTDHLLALRALLDGDDSGSGTLSLRLAALCADPSDRQQVATTVERAFSLERYVIRGDADAAYLDNLGVDSADEIATELEEALRAILRDAMTGLLDRDLKRAADQRLLAESGVAEPPQEGEPGDHDGLPGRPRRPGAASLLPKDGMLAALFRRTDFWDLSQETAELEAIAPPAVATEPEHLASNGRQVEDWGFEDAEDYSAPV